MAKEISKEWKDMDAHNNRIITMHSQTMNWIKLIFVYKTLENVGGDFLS